MSNLFWIFVSAAIVTNFVLVYFLGLCPVIGVTNKSETGWRLGLATTFVMVLASLAAWVLNRYVLGAAPSTYRFSTQAARLANTITKVVARPRRQPVSLLFVTPITGHRPRKYTSTKFVTIAAETKIQKRLLIR